MKPENSAKRKKMLLRFGALYAGSIALLIMIFTFLNGQEIFGLNGQETSGSAEGPDNALLPSNPSLFSDRINALFRRHLEQLKELDEKYAVLLTDSTGLHDLAGTDKMIAAAEATLKNSMDSLDKEGPLYSTWTASYRAILEDRRPIAAIRAALAAGRNGGISVDQLELLRLKMELSGKDKDLADLESRLKTVQIGKDPSQGIPAGGRDLPTAGHDLPAASRDLPAADQAMLLALQNENKALRESVVSLRHNNELLAAKSPGTGKPAGAAEAVDGPARNIAVPSTDQNRGSETKLEELSAELRFAQVDCNLSRADARQTVYNSKQRKDLLEDALATLKELATSDDLAVQRKAKEKLTLLGRIASTIHD